MRNYMYVVGAGSALSTSRTCDGTLKLTRMKSHMLAVCVASVILKKAAYKLTFERTAHKGEAVQMQSV